MCLKPSWNETAEEVIKRASTKNLEMIFGDKNENLKTTKTNPLSADDKNHQDIPNMFKKHESM